jgi:hypothetical protein
MFTKDELDLIEHALASFAFVCYKDALDCEKSTDPAYTTYAKERRKLMESAKALRNKIKGA